MAIRFERDGAVGNIVLANPPFNRLDLCFAKELRIAVHQASESDIRVLVVRSEGPHFSFGGEVREWPGRCASKSGSPARNPFQLATGPVLGEGRLGDTAGGYVLRLRAGQGVCNEIDRSQGCIPMS